MKKFLVMAVAALSLSLASCSDKAQNNDEASVAIEALQSQLANGDASGIQATLENVKAKVAELVAQNPDAAKAYVAKVQEFLKENAEKVTALVGDNAVTQTLFSTIVNTPSDVVVQTLASGQSVVDNAQEQLQDAADAIGQAAQEKVDEANAAIEDGKEKIADEVDKAAQKVNDAVSEGADKLLKGAGLK